MRSDNDKKDVEARYKLVTEIYEAGTTCAAEIARRISISPRTVLRYINLWKARTPVENIKPRGRPPKVSPKNRSFIRSEIAKNPFITASGLQMRLLEQKNVQVIYILITGFS